MFVFFTMYFQSFYCKQIIVNLKIIIMYFNNSYYYLMYFFMKFY